MAGRAQVGARTRGKSDPIDALAVARAAIREPDLPRAFLAGPEREIALLVNHRANLVGERTRASQAAAAGCCTTSTRRSSRPAHVQQREPLERLDRRLARLTRPRQSGSPRSLRADPPAERPRIDQLKRELAPLVRRHAPALLTLTGCGMLVAARILAEVANVARFRTDAQLALYAGVAPLDASSGRQQRHRLNRTGNRQLNHALHIIAITQARIYAPAARLPRAPRSDGKTTKEALRAFKRHLIRRVFTTPQDPPARPTIAVDAPIATPA